ncbi:MAG: hypothetical protein DYG98_12530 [Haliscomenobacteraceae bacterium CHB4]|nr:hypothetical protein [Saprospiraceae bacterium]MCE7923877.1 hypothetical protein [Haliscomenobacteraceae bacterium CHB4]
MKKLLHAISLIGYALCLPVILTAQEPANTEVLQIQPTIMVVPWTSQDEDMRKKLESDFAYRAVLNEVRAAFDKRDFTTIDFVEALKIAATDRITGMQNWRDLFKDVIDNSPAEIEVLTEIYIQPEKYGNKVNILLAANDKYSGESIANSGMISSEPVNTTDYALLAKKALEKDDAIGKFLNSMQNKFTEMVQKNGRSIAVRVEVKEGCPFNLQTEVGEDGDYVSDLITDWVKKNAYKNNYKLKGKTASLMDFTYIKIPLRDAEGNNYDINNFSRIMRKAIRSMGDKTDKRDKFKLEELIRGNKLIITIMQ